MKIVVTGTHLSPALAVARLLKENHKILFLGRKNALEGDKALSLDYQIIKSEGYEFKNLITGRLQRKWTRYTIPSLLKVPLGFFQGLWFLVGFKPDLILSFGSYVSLPVVIVAFILGIPVIIHEQTLGAGLSNRIAALFAKKVLISWESSRKFFPKEKTILTGNPVREEIFRVKGKGFRVKGDLPIIYVTGGSLGSHVINMAIEKIIKKLLRDFVIIHQTGGSRQYRDFERLNKLRESLEPKLKERYFLTKYVDFSTIGWVLNQAKLVISRAGANTISELLALGKPALLIPLPFSSSNEQMGNALLFKNIGLGEILSQDELTNDKLLSEIKGMMKNINDYEKNKKNSRKLVGRDAAQKIKEVVLNEI